MNYIQHLSAFLELVKHDTRLSAHHITLYLALFYQWNLAYFKNPLCIVRAETMAMAKIGSNNTYLKCLSQLHQWNYIQYKPSRNPQKGSLIYLYTFDISNLYTFDTSGVIVVHPSINNINKYKQECLRHKSKKSKSENFNSKNNPMNTSSKNLKSVSQSENTPHEKTNSFPPPLEFVKIYFSEKNVSVIEAEKFFNYFESNGWLVGGRAKMKDWKAAARNWMINIKQFNPEQKPTPNTSSLNTSKNYNEPL